MEHYYRPYTDLPLWDRDKKWALVDTGALRQNYRKLRGLISPEKTLIAVVKADAYGHGAPACVAALLEEGCGFFAVSCLSEGITVRNTCRSLGRSAEILVLSPASPNDVSYLCEFDLTGTLTSLAQAEALSSMVRSGAVLRLHAAVDTGMHRIGFPAFSESESLQAADDLCSVQRLPRLRIEGIFSHFARSDEESEAALQYTFLQKKRFSAFCKLLEEKGAHIPFRHLCNTAALPLSPGLHLDGARVGIGLYGYGGCASSLSLRPVLRLQTSVAHLHTAMPGDTVGYGGKFAPSSPRLIATLPIGYADGFLRAYSGGLVTVHTSLGDCRVPVVGAVCMDQCMLDVTDTPTRLGDTVTLFGDAPASLEELARRGGTIPYESLCLISSRIPRRYL